MKKFVFGLGRVLEIRELRRVLAEEQLGERLVDERRAKEQLLSSLQKREELFSEFREEISGEIQARNLGHLAMYRESVEDEIFRREGELRRKEDLTDSARKEAVLRTQEQKALEKHRENQVKEYKARYWWQQGKELDEIGADRFGRSERR